MIAGGVIFGIVFYWLGWEMWVRWKNRNKWENMFQRWDEMDKRQ